MSDSNKEHADLLADMNPIDKLLLQQEVEQFLYHEADLLDNRLYEDWLGLLAEDIHYWMPIRRTTMARDIASEFTKPGDMAFFNDNKQFLELRVKKISAGNAWSEDPPSRTRHMVNNIKIRSVLSIDSGEEISISLNFHLYRTRLESEEDSWIGRREDMLRRVDGKMMLAKRHIFLEQTLLKAQNLSSIF